MSTPSHFSLKFKPVAEILGACRRSPSHSPGVNDQAFSGRHLAARPSSQRRLDSWSVSIQHASGGVRHCHPAASATHCCPRPTGHPKPGDPVTDCAIGTSGSKHPGSCLGSLESSQASCLPTLVLLFFPPDFLTLLPDCDSQGS